MPKQEKTFDAVAWTRARRDELHRQHADLPTRAFVRRLSEEGEQRALWKRLSERHGQPREAA